MIYIQSFFIWLYTKSPLICYNKSKANGLEHCESSILYREGFILCYPSKRDGDSLESPPLFDRRPAPALGMGCAGNRNRLRAAQGNALRHAACLFTR